MQMIPTKATSHLQSTASPTATLPSASGEAPFFQSHDPDHKDGLRYKDYCIFEQGAWEAMSQQEQDIIRAEYNPEMGRYLIIAKNGFFAASDDKKYPLVEDGNAAFFLDHCQLDILWKVDQRRLYYYGRNPINNCICWIPDKDEIWLKRKLAAFAVQLQGIINSVSNPDLEKNQSESALVVKKALATEKKNIESRYIAFAGRGRQLIIERIKESVANNLIVFDNPQTVGHLLNCPNGTYNMRSRQLETPCKDHYITQGCPTEYHKDAKCKIWTNFIETIAPTADIRQQLAQSLGVALDASVSVKKLFLMYGRTTNNGKTTLVNALKDVLGKADKSGYVSSISAGTFDMGARSGGKNTPELASVGSARILTMSEPRENQPIDWSYVKDATGGGEISITPKYRDTYTVMAAYTLFIETNYLIRLDDPTLFSSGRMFIIPFLANLPQIGMDLNMPVKLREKECREAALAWILQGYADYKDNGETFTMPKESQSILAGYQAASDKIKDFMDEFFVPSKSPKSYVKYKDVYPLYKKYCEEHGYRPENQGSFRTKLDSRGYDVHENSDKTKCVYGIERKPECRQQAS